MFFSSLFLAASLVTFRPYSIDEAGQSIGTGRLGDKTIILSKAVWVSYKYGIPWTYDPFEGMELFQFYNEQKEHHHTFLRRKHIVFPNTANKPKDNHCYIVNMLWQDAGWDDPIETGLWHTAIHDDGFRKRLQHVLKPKITIPTLVLAENKENIALHIRVGNKKSIAKPFYTKSDLTKPAVPSGTNKSALFPYGEDPDIHFPFKFPPYQYYVDRVHDMYTLLGKKPMHIHLFTDYDPVEDLIELLLERIDIPDITMTAGTVAEHNAIKAGDEFDTTVTSSIRDIYLMTQCDHFIRSGSNFAQLAHLVGNFKTVLFPIESKWYKGNILAYPKVGIYESSTRSTFLLNTLEKNDLSQYRSLKKINVEK